MKDLISFREYMVHRAQEPQKRQYGYSPPRNIPQPVGTRQRDPDKPSKVRNLEASKAREAGKPYGRQKDAIDKMFTGK